MTIELTYGESIDIAGPPEAVWAVVADPRKDSQWCRKVKAVEAIDTGCWRVVHKRER